MTSSSPEVKPHDQDQVASSHLFEIKGGSIHVPILKLFSGDIDAVASRLLQKVQQAPDFFRNAPVVIDLHELGDATLIDFRQLGQVLRECGLVPIGVRARSGKLLQAAREADLAVLADSKHEAVLASPAPSVRAPAPKASSQPALSTRLVEQPVRSGQRIYAVGGDLVVLAQVSAGAEIMADGNIHVYGTLRGRAMAGVQGNLGCRIFCRDLQAELVAIGGHYKISEHLDAGVRGKPVQIYLRDSSLIIEDL